MNGLMICYICRENANESFAISSAASEGHLDCIKYLHQNVGLWDHTATWWAVNYGHYDCLKYLHENGYPWNIKAI